MTALLSYKHRNIKGTDYGLSGENMIKIDLITGFLGSGKTTFIKKDAQYLIDQGYRIGIIENDFGAVNVDMMLLQDLESENCELEMVAGACDKDCHQRRFKTKLISMGMREFDRVLVEPSGIFDVEEFFDVLHEEPLTNWYEIGNVFAIVDASLEKNLSKEASYLLASQIVSAGKIFVTTNLAAAVATVTVMMITWIRYKKPDVSMTYNAALAGLVGITAGCDAVSPVGAAVIGIICGILIVLAVEFFDKIAKIDDPVGAVSVHCVCGATGTILTGLFATGVTTEAGLFYGGGVHLLAVQAAGVVSVAVYVAVVITIVFLAIKYTIGLRADAEDEIAGLDVSEHGLLTAYAGFAMQPDIAAEGEAVPAAVTGDVPAAEAIPVKKVPSFEEGTPKFTKIEIVCRESKFEALKNAMMKLGITGMTVSHVLGCGAQKGKPEYYRGVQVEASLLPKVQVEIVVSAVPVRKVIETAKKVLYTGHIGDGKIFVYDVENVVKVRTGEEGFDALQDVE